MDDMAKILMVLVEAFPTNKISPTTIEVYKRTLADIPPSVLEMATLHLISSMKFFPTVSEIRDAAFDIIVSGSKIPSAYEAWQEVESEISRCGEYFRYDIIPNRPVYSHPIIERAVEIMGYKALLYSDNVVADRAHFFRVYESLYNRAVADIKMLPAVKDFEEKRLVSEPVKLIDKEGENRYV